MSDVPYKPIAIGCFVVCAMALFVAWERYQANASNVNAVNNMMNSSPVGGMMRQMTGTPTLKPATPAITKYAIAVAVLAAIGGVACMTMSTNKPGHSTQTRASASSNLPEKMPGLDDDNA